MPLKTLKKNGDKRIKKAVDHEIEAFRKLKGKLKHKNILEIYEISRSLNNLYIVMEYCRHGDLAGLIKRKKKLS